MEVEKALYYTIMLLNHTFKYPKREFFGYQPVYPFNTEDSSTVFNDYQNMIKGETVMTVTGSGDACLDLTMYGAKKIISFDANLLAKYYASLKLAFLSSGLDFQKFISFFLGPGRGSEILQYGTYLEIRDKLYGEYQYYWDQVFQYIHKNNIKITNTETAIMFAQFNMFFANINTSMQNENGYLNIYNSENNYNKLQDIVMSEDFKAEERIEFIDSDVLSVDSQLNDTFNFIYLSNIIDYLEYCLKSGNANQKLRQYRAYISTILEYYRNPEGIIVAGYLTENRPMQQTVLYDPDDYRKIFKEEDNYLLERVSSRREDHIIVKCSEEYIKAKKRKLYEDYY